MTNQRPTAPTNLPPHDRDAERAVLGAVIRDPEVFADVQVFIGAHSFYLDPHRRIFEAMASLAAAGVPIDLVTLYDRLKKRGELEDVGGRMDLIDLWEAVPTGANALYHADLIANAALLRGLIYVANEITRDCYSPTGSARDLVSQAEQKIFALAAKSHQSGQGSRSVGELLKGVLARLDERIANGGGLNGLSTGFVDLDGYLGGLRPGELIVVGARPSVGKTSFCLNIADHLAVGGTPVLFFSLEMPATDITERLLSMTSKVPMYRFARPRDLSERDIDAVFVAGSPTGIAGVPLFIEDTPDQTASRIASEARRAVLKHGVQLIVVDYLQLMCPENSSENRTQQVGAQALKMKNMARSLNVPVILLSQLNRDVEHGGRLPRLSDLKESGDIEAHADRVILLHREANLPAGDQVWPIELVLAKNRNGPVGEMRLAYRRPVLQFENMAHGSY